MKFTRRMWQIVIIFVLILIGFKPVPASAAQLSSPEAQLLTMSAEEKIGQLFLVGFDGTDVGEGSEIYDLITEYHIGGVVLLAENRNFTANDTIAQTQQMIEALQSLEWESSSGVIDVEASASVASPAYIPLFIGMKQLGNGYPGDEISTGLTELPSQMAVGATWDLDLANRVGEVLGEELNALGINLYLGPNLDVLETTNGEAARSIRVNTFGGDPYWVGEMGKAFVSGVHTGSENRMLVVAQNFPGTGSSDRPPDSEVATVRKSLEQLKQIELAPYFAVTTPSLGEPERVDGLMVSHIRYQGFQGNIRATTRPISFDSNAFQQIMALPQFETWREDGGLIISDNLGSLAVRRFFDPNDNNFEAPQVARNAFLAGNDILYVDDFIASGDPDTFTTLQSTLAFFVQKYREDSAFAQRVDGSVLKILSAKMDVFGEFIYENVVRQDVNLDTLGASLDVSADVAQNAVTLINPSVQELDSVVPSPPTRYEGIVIFTDMRTIRPCASCPLSNAINLKAFSDSLISLYGPQAGSLVYENFISSYNFSQLIDFLDNVENTSNEFLFENLSLSDWIIFFTLDINPDYPESNALQRVLTERPDLLTGKNVLVFSMDLPTYLDSTNISKVTAYYALYSKAAPFFDVAARVLMQELVPPGALPVSLSSVGYDLISITAPDPEQVIELELMNPEEETVGPPVETPDLTPTPGATPTPGLVSLPSYNVGDTITIKTGQIYDHNHNVVPDGTIVRFNFRISGEQGITQQFETTTTGGVAFFNYLIEAAGNLEVNATSEPATQSETLQINISQDGSTVVMAVSPTPMVTATPTVTATATETVTPTPTSTPAPVRNQYPTLGEWALGVIVMGLGGAIAFLIGFFWWGSTRWGLRSALCALIGGLLTYTYLNMGLSGTEYWLIKSGTIFVIEVVVVGLLIGWIVALIWWMRTEGRYPSRRRL
ncbi:MAG: glycoside hydrolase family 3 N-terminal domain-containing protein [Anaerolineales bacterium]